MKDFVGILASKSTRRTYVTIGMQQGLSSMTMSKRTRHADPNTLLQYGDDDENLFRCDGANQTDVAVQSYRCTPVQYSIQ